MKHAAYCALLLCCSIFLNSCSHDSILTEPTTTTSSWAALQEKVITPVCAGCHTAGTDYALQSGLVLTPDVAYTNLFNVAAHHTNANADGLLRIKPSDAEKSFLYLKVHGLPQGKDYGNPMPLGSRGLSIGQMEFIRQWIAAGAPKDGVVADKALLDDTSHTPIADFVPLQAPTLGTGYQMHIDKFDVAPHFERELFVYKPINNASDIYVNRIQMRMRPNSHHFLLYTFQSGTPASIIPPYDVVRDIRNPDGSQITANTLQMGYHEYFAGSTIPDLDYHFPPGTALKVPANTSLDLNTHYISRTDDHISGECYANLYTVDKSQVQHEAGTLALSNNNISLSPGEHKVVAVDYPNPYALPLHVFMLTSHMHERGQKYRILFKGKSGDSRNGQVLYESDDWAHPLVKNFDTPLIFNQGEGLSSEVTYYNNTNRHITFGLTSDDEMDIIFAYYFVF